MSDKNVTPGTTETQDRLQAIRARLDAMPSDRPWHVIEVSALIPHVRADIAWLLDEVEAWRNHCGCCDCQRLRGGEVIGCICDKCKRHRQERSHA